MRLFVNTVTGAIQTDPAYPTGQTIQAVYLSPEPLELQFGSNDPVTNVWTPVLLDDPTGMIAGLKFAKVYDGDFATSCSIFTAPGTAAGFYTGTLSFNTDAIKNELNDDSDTTNDVASIALQMEVDYKPNGHILPAKSKAIAVQVNNAIVRGNEGATVPANPSFPSWSTINTVLQNVTGLTGGGTNLDAVATAGGVAPLVVTLPRCIPSQWWQRELTVTSSSVANPSVITTADDHKLETGDTVTIGGHSGSTPDINGDHVVTVTGARTFTIAVNVTGAGTGGFVTPSTDLTGGGTIRPTDWDAATNARFWQSF